jgi:hypothetical protein
MRLAVAAELAADPMFIFAMRSLSAFAVAMLCAVYFALLMQPEYREGMILISWVFFIIGVNTLPDAV